MEPLELGSVCPSCGGHEYAPLGLMGARAHYRCRQCGWMWSERLDPELAVRLAEDDE